MSWTSLLTVIQITLALLFGALVARRLRTLIRTLVLRAMPVEKRISEESFNIQTRASTIAAFAVAGILGFAAYMGLNELTGPLKPYLPVSSSNTTEIMDLPEPVESPLVSDSEINDTPVRPAYSRSDLTTPSPDTYEPSSSTSARIPAPALPTDAESQAGRGPSPATPPAYPDQVDAEPRAPSSLRVFLQLAAFVSPERAQEFSHRYRHHPVHTLTLWESAVPHKVLVGPFPSRAAAIRYRQAYDLHAFIRYLP